MTIARIAGSCAAIRFGVKPAWKSIFSRSCLGGSMPMNIARMSSSGKPVGDGGDAAELGRVRLASRG